MESNQQILTANALTYINVFPYKAVVPIAKHVGLSRTAYVCRRAKQLYNGIEWVSEWVSDCCLTPRDQFINYIVYHGESKFYFDEMICPLCTRPTSLEHIILIPSQHEFALTRSSCMLNWEAAKTNLMTLVWSNPERVLTIIPQMWL
jgi:hypothetical protein